MTPMWNLWFATKLKSWLVLTSLTSIYVTPLKCVSFEIIFKDFFLVAFAFTRFWFVGLFREQAQSRFVRRRVWGKKYKQEHAQGLWLGQQTFEQLVGEKLVHTFHFLTTFLLLFFFILLVFWVFLNKEYVHVLSKFVSLLVLFCF